MQNAVLSPTKRSAISYKTQCYLLQNAVLTPTKHSAISCKTQGKCSKTQNKVLHFADCREAFCLKNNTWITCFWTEKWRKKWVFTTKKWFLGRQKMASQTPNRTPKGAKRRFCAEIWCNAKRNWWKFGQNIALLALIFARIVVFGSLYCKIIILNLTRVINVCTCK